MRLPLFINFDIKHVELRETHIHLKEKKIQKVSKKNRVPTPTLIQRHFSIILKIINAIQEEFDSAMRGEKPGIPKERKNTDGSRKYFLCNLVIFNAIQR